MPKIANILILGAGDSTRFWPLQDKVLFSFLGKPLIQHVVEGVAPFAGKIFVVTDQAKKQIITKLFGKKVEVITQSAGKQSQAKAVLAAKAIKGEVLVLAGSELFDFNLLKQFASKIEERRIDALFLAKEFNHYFPGGYLKMDNNKITAIVEKPHPNALPSNKVKLVVDYIANWQLFLSCLQNVEGTNSEDLYERGLNLYIRQSKKVDYLLTPDVWPLKYPWHVLPLMHHFLAQIKRKRTGKRVQISSKALLVPPVYLGGNVKIGNFAKIVGPCFIDEDTIIGDYAMVRESHIGKNCLVGGYSEVTRSYLGEDVSLHRNYVGDSVLDKGSLMGGGATIANFRFDGKTVKSSVGDDKIDTHLLKFGAILGEGVKIGVNSVVLPGVKIGKHTFLSPGKVAEKDIEDNMFIFKDEVRKNKEI